MSETSGRGARWEADAVLRRVRRGGMSGHCVGLGREAGSRTRKKSGIRRDGADGASRACVRGSARDRRRRERRESERSVEYRPGDEREFECRRRRAEGVRGCERGARDAPGCSYALVLRAMSVQSTTSPQDRRQWRGRTSGLFQSWPISVRIRGGQDRRFFVRTSRTSSLWGPNLCGYRAPKRRANFK